MTHGTCPCCGRAFKSAAARQLAERRASVITDLKGEALAAHLAPEALAAEATRIDETARQPYYTYNRDHAEG